MKQGQYLIISLLLLSSVFLFQNCSYINSRLVSGVNQDSNKLNPINVYVDGGNGDPYGGKLFFYFEPGYKCTDSNGNSIATYKERIEIKDNQIIHSINQCGKEEIFALNEDQVRERGSILQYRDQLFVDVGRGFTPSSAMPFDVNFYWEEYICDSSRMLELNWGYPNEFFEFKITTNYMGTRLLNIKKTDLSNGSVIYNRQLNLDFNDTGVKYWLSGDESIFISDGLNIGEASIIENNMPRNIGLNCVLK